MVEITSVQLPKVKIRISNPDQSAPCIIWAPGVSWEEQNKWFSLRPTAGEKVWGLHPKHRIYTVNFPKPEVIPAGKSVDCSYDFSDGTWELPKGFVPGDWKYEIQARLEIIRDDDAHRFGVFTGHVTSAWQNHKGHEVEKAAPPVLDKNRTATETRKDFPWQDLTARLEQWNSGTLPDNQTIGDFLGAKLPWKDCECCYTWPGELVVILPEQGLLSFRFYNDQPAAFKTMRIEGKLKEVVHRDWFPAQSTLTKVRARMLSSIALSKGTEPPLLFRRAFDKEGRVDAEETEILSR
ncbi:MAG: hypothetical protein ACKV19_21315 [Verrucomicrobiales bacterium]